MGGGGVGRVVVRLVLLPLPGLDAVLLEGDRSRLVVDLLIEPAGVTDYVAGGSPPPEGGLHSAAIGARCALAPARGDARVLGFDEGPVGPVHLVVETAGVAEVVPGGVAPPQRGGGDSAVHALAAVLRLLLRAGGGAGLWEGVGQGGVGDVGGGGGGG